MREETNAGVCRCLAGPNGKQIAKFAFEFGEVQIYYCRICDGITVEVLGFRPEHYPDQRVFDVLADSPADRSVLVLSGSWVISMANILNLYAQQ